MLLQLCAQHGIARGAITLAEQVFGRGPAVVLGQKAANEAIKGGRILVDAVEALHRVTTLNPAVACARRVDEHHVGRIDQRLRIRSHLVRSPDRMLQVRQLHTHRSQRGHAQVHRRRSWAAVVEERDRPRRCVGTLGEVGCVEDVRGGGLLF